MYAGHGSFRGPPRRIEPGSDPISISDGWIQMSYIGSFQKIGRSGPHAIKTAKNPKDTGIGVRVPPIEWFVIEMDQVFQGSRGEADHCSGPFPPQHSQVVVHQTGLHKLPLGSVPDGIRGF